MAVFWGLCRGERGVTDFFLQDPNACPHLPFIYPQRMLQPRKAFRCTSITLGMIGASMTNEGGLPLTPAQGALDLAEALTLETEIPSWGTEDSRLAWVTW